MLLHGIYGRFFRAFRNRSTSINVSNYRLTGGNRLKPTDKTDISPAETGDTKQDTPTEGVETETREQSAAAEPSETPLSELEKIQKESREYLDSLQRLKAEFDNFRKRTVKERQRLAELHQSLVLEAILPTLDSFDAALKKTDHSDGESVFQGLRMIYDGLMASLNKIDFKKMELVGDPFDPEKAEALMTQPTETHDPDTVIDVISEGYTFKGRVLRPARVVVSAPASGAAPSDSEKTSADSEETNE